MKGGGLTLKNGNYNIINQLDKLITIGNENCDVNIIGKKVTINGKEINDLSTNIVKVGNKSEVLLGRDENNLNAGYMSIAGNYGTTAAGSRSIAFNNVTIASGENSSAFGSLGEASGANSFKQGNECQSKGVNTFAGGYRTIAQNESEFAIGRYNNSNTGNSKDKNTMFSVGIGTSPSDRKNAIEIMNNGDIYIYGIGGYDGTNYSTAKTLQEVINEITQ